MNLILLSGRDASRMHMTVRLDQDATFAEALAAAGCDVRWIVPLPPGEAAPVAPSVRVVPVASRSPGFASVVGRVVAPEIELEVAKQVRGELPAVVHLLDYGGDMPGNASWVAQRLGARVLVSLRAAPVLCHRGDLIHADRTACTDWSDPKRCTACCLVADSRGLSPFGSIAGRLLGALHSPINPYPRPVAFANRGELVFGGLHFVDCIAVADDTDRERVASCGVPLDRFTVLPSPEIADWLALYRRLSGS